MAARHCLEAATHYYIHPYVNTYIYTKYVSINTQSIIYKQKINKHGKRFF